MQPEAADAAPGAAGAAGSILPTDEQLCNICFRRVGKKNIKKAALNLLLLILGIIAWARRKIDISPIFWSDFEGVSVRYEL